MKKICFLILGTVLLLSCATTTPAIAPASTATPIVETPGTLPDPTDPAQPLVAKVGQAFDIVLPANASTGYRWKITGAPETSLVQSVEENYIPRQPVMPGSDGMDVWTFKALAPGQTTIEFGYFPPGNTDQPDETVVFTIRIEA
jgi:predicted secreted protein